MQLVDGTTITTHHVQLLTRTVSINIFILIFLRRVSSAFESMDHDGNAIVKTASY